jgi:hypothetical protein
MKITKCSDNSQSTFQYFNHGFSKCCHSQSGSFFGAFAFKLPKITLPSTYFSIEFAFFRYLLLLAFFKTFNCCLLTFYRIFKMSGYHL